MNAPTGLRDGIDARQWRELAERLFDELRTRSTDDPGVTRECYAAGENAAITLLRETAAEYGANLLLNVGPDPHGRMPERHRRYLTKAREMWEERPRSP